MNKIPVNIDTMKAEIDCSKNGVYIVKDGEAIEVPPPQSGFGKWEVNWKDGKPLDVLRSERFRV